MCVQKTPLAEVFFFFPGDGARKDLMAGVVDDDEDYNQSVGKPKRKV
jgi:hypothetical protein